MTTVIKVSAHCANDKEVQIDLTNTTLVTLQDGEEHEAVVYDGISCTVKEIEKAQAEPMNGDLKDPPKPDTK